MKLCVRLDSEQNEIEKFNIFAANGEIKLKQIRWILTQRRRIKSQRQQLCSWEQNESGNGGIKLAQAEEPKH